MLGCYFGAQPFYSLCANTVLVSTFPTRSAAATLRLQQYRTAMFTYITGVGDGVLLTRIPHSLETYPGSRAVICMYGTHQGE